MIRYKDWMNQAREDLKAAKDSISTEHYEWVCFQSQQSSEKALKALLQYHNIESRGHSLIRLLHKLQQLGINIPDELWVFAQELDMQYIQPRYPNGFSEGYPSEYYNKEIAERCINYATRIFEFVEQSIE